MSDPKLDVEKINSVDVPFPSQVNDIRADTSWNFHVYAHIYSGECVEAAVNQFRACIQTSDHMLLTNSTRS